MDHVHRAVFIKDINHLQPAATLAATEGQVFAVSAVTGFAAANDFFRLSR